MADKIKLTDSTSPLRIEGVHYKTGKPVSIEINNGTISSIDEILEVQDKDLKFIISPGLIDNQINGYAKVDFSGNELSAEGIISATKAIWKEGVTSFMPTLITNSHDNIIKNLKILDEACRKDKMMNDSIPGIHLEGPYLSPEEGFRGCHPVEYMRKPSWEEFSMYRKASGGRIIQVTIAPELEGAFEFIKKCSGAGIKVAIGHSNASVEQIDAAVNLGASLSTHLGNGCANLIPRHKNPIWPQLANDGLIPSIIADGHHLLPEEIKVFYKVKGVNNTILTSDVMFMAGMTPGRYSFLGLDVVLKEDGLLINEKLNCLAGASFPLRTGVGNIIKFTGCTLADAIMMASENPARIYNLSDRGTLETGKRADLILFENEQSQIRIKKTFKNGILVFHDSF